MSARTGLLGDVFAEALAGLAVRGLRSALTTLGVVLGVGALVTTVGISASASNQIMSRLDELRATEIVVERRAGPTGAGRPMPWSVDGLTRLDGVRHAAGLGTVGREVRARTVVTGAGPAADGVGLNVVAAGPDALATLRGALTAGRFLDPVDDRAGARVAVLGAGAAGRLRLYRVAERPAVFLDGRPYVVVGILGAVGREPALLNAVLVSPARAAADFDLAGPDRVVVDVEAGAAAGVARYAALALDPRAPEQLVTRTPPDRQLLRRGVAEDVNALFLALGVLSLIVGGVGIANVMLVNVLERRPEIGLRRALGASRPAIAAQMLIEAGLMGGVGGVIGTSAGVLATVGTALARHWTPVLALEVPLLAPLAGVIVGLVAGGYPAWRAARMEPIAALRL